MRDGSYIASSHSRKRQKKDNFITRLVVATSIISVLLISVAVYLLSTLPREAFDLVWNASTSSTTKSLDIVLPKPDEETRQKADRLREIRYEDYLERSYKPLPAEMDNVYINDYDKKCYLTFDDGPSPVTETILDVLDKYKVKATFFVIGQRAEANPQLLKKIVSAGHSVGNHSYSHDYTSVYTSGVTFRNEVEKCKKAIDTALGEEYNNLIFRFPGGYNSLQVESDMLSYREALSGLGYKYIDWSCLTGDSNTTDPTEELLMETLRCSIGSTKTGDIVVLMHDSATKEITAKALPKIIEYLYSEGYVFEALNNEKK